MLHIGAEVENGDQIKKPEDQNHQLSGDETEGDYEPGLMELSGYEVDRIQKTHIGIKDRRQADRYRQQHQNGFPQFLFSF